MYCSFARKERKGRLREKRRMERLNYNLCLMQIEFHFPKLRCTNLVLNGMLMRSMTPHTFDGQSKGTTSAGSTPGPNMHNETLPHCLLL